MCQRCPLFSHPNQANTPLLTPLRPHPILRSEKTPFLPLSPLIILIFYTFILLHKNCF